MTKRMESTYLSWFVGSSLQCLPTHRTHPYKNLSQTSTNFVLNIPLPSSLLCIHSFPPHNHNNTIATMKLSTVFAAAMALMMPAAVSGQNIGDSVTTSVLVVEYVPAVSTSTVYQTTQFTVWSCPPDVTNCPLRSATSLAMVTAIVGMSTTICPVTFVSTRVSSYTTPASTSFASLPGATVSSASVISTTYSTGSSTITIGSSTTSWSFWSTISYSATSTPSIVTSQATLYSGGPSLPTGVTDISTSTGISAAASSGSAGSAGSGLASASASSGSAGSGPASSGIPSGSSASSASVFNPAGASSSSAASNAASASAIVSTSVAANGSSYTISYSPLGTGSLTSVVGGLGSTNNISVPSGPTGSGPLPTYTGMAGREAVMTALSALAFGMVAALVLV